MFVIASPSPGYSCAFWRIPIDDALVARYHVAVSALRIALFPHYQYCDNANSSRSDDRALQQRSGLSLCIASSVFELT
jgi:hypothetical protein